MSLRCCLPSCSSEGEGELCLVNTVAPLLSLILLDCEGELHLVNTVAPLLSLIAYQLSH